MKMYEAKTFFNEINEVYPERVTDHYVFFENERTKRLSINKSFFLTWEEAHEWLLKEAQRDVDQARRRLEIFNGKLGNVKGMKKPEGEE